MAIIKKKYARMILILTAILLMIMTSGCGSKPVEKPKTNPEPTKQEVPKETKASSQPAKPAPASSTQVSSTANNDYSKLLTPAEVEKVGKLKDVKIAPKDPKIGAGGDVNYAVGNEMVLMLQVHGGSFYSQMKATPFYKKDLSGVGDEAFWGSSGVNDSLNGITFRKGDRTISITAFYDLNNDTKPYFNQDQLMELAKLVLSRI